MMPLWADITRGTISPGGVLEWQYPWGRQTPKLNRKFRKPNWMQDGPAKSRPPESAHQPTVTSQQSERVSPNGLEPGQHIRRRHSPQSGTGPGRRRRQVSPGRFCTKLHFEVRFYTEHGFDITVHNHFSWRFRTQLHFHNLNDKTPNSQNLRVWRGWVVNPSSAC